MTGKTLYRSRTQRMVGGVCGGLGAFFGIDPTLVRLLFVIGSLLGWAGFLVLTYIIMMFVVPEEPLGLTSTAPESSQVVDLPSPDEK
jgi:phage shock protein PspC (stress-responsive transcriptional regulator)